MIKLFYKIKNKMIRINNNLNQNNYQNSKC